jgi:competence protein ComEA
VPQVEQGGVPLPGVSAEPEPSGEVVVAVAGLVVTPGLVRLPAGSRVDDAVRAAGGVAPGADIGLLNLARTLVDGEQVLVGVDPPPGTAPGAPPAGGAASGLVDLNAATVGDFDALPGIGPVLAQRIVDWRTENGRFASVDQLREVTGIGESKYRDLEDKVTV